MRHAENLIRVDLLSFLPEVLGTFKDLLANEECGFTMLHDQIALNTFILGPEHDHL